MPRSKVCSPIETVLMSNAQNKSEHTKLFGKQWSRDLQWFSTRRTCYLTELDWAPNYKLDTARLAREVSPARTTCGDSV